MDRMLFPLCGWQNTPSQISLVQISREGGDGTCGPAARLAERLAFPVTDPLTQTCFRLGAKAQSHGAQPNV
jgi:hypothetical protein